MAHDLQQSVMSVVIVQNRHPNSYPILSRWSLTHSETKHFLSLITNLRTRLSHDFHGSTSSNLTRFDVQFSTPSRESAILWQNSPALSVIAAFVMIMTRIQNDRHIWKIILWTTIMHLVLILQESRQLSFTAWTIDDWPRLGPLVMDVASGPSNCLESDFQAISLPSDVGRNKCSFPMWIEKTWRYLCRMEKAESFLSFSSSENWLSQNWMRFPERLSIRDDFKMSHAIVCGSANLRINTEQKVICQVNTMQVTVSRKNPVTNILSILSRFPDQCYARSHNSLRSGEEGMMMKYCFGDRRARLWRSASSQSWSLFSPTKRIEIQLGEAGHSYQSLFNVILWLSFRWWE
jgi:hypothetical protein